MRVPDAANDGGAKGARGIHDAPVSGPPIMAEADRQPTAIAPKPPRHAPSVATDMITSISANERSHSMTNALADRDAERVAGSVAPNRPPVPSTSTQRSRGRDRPTHCATM